MNEEVVFKNHPIAIEQVLVKELSIIARTPPSAVPEDIQLVFTISVGHSAFDELEKGVVVALKLETDNNEGNENPFSLRIEIVAGFKVDLTRFPIEKVEHWASKNAPFILYPYLREQVYGLTARCGYNPFLLPLVEVPTFKSGIAPEEKSN